MAADSLTAGRFDPVTMPLAGVHSIAASAGTGKTYAITTLYLRYLLELDHPTDRILVTTFTEAATSELKDRLRKRISDALAIVRNCSSSAEADQLVEQKRADAQIVSVLKTAGAWRDGFAGKIRDRLDDAKSNFDQAPVFTIHGFCSRILQELVFETGTRFNTELVSSLDELLEEAVCDFVARHWATDDSRLARWLKLDAGLFAELLDVAHQCLENPDAVVVPADRNLEESLDAPGFRRFAAVAEELADVWQREQQAVRKLLFAARESGWLNGNTHGKPGQIEKSLGFLETLAALQSPSVLKWDAKAEKLDSEQDRLTQQRLIAGTKKEFKTTAPRHRLFELLDEIAELAPQLVECQAGLRSALLAGLASFAREHVRRRKQERGLMSFGDLLHEVDQALGGRQQELLLRSLRERYFVALIDEFQDTDPVQYRIFSTVFQQAASGFCVEDENGDGDGTGTGFDTAAGRRAFVMIGDPKQSIYRFRGADIQAYLKATSETPTANCHAMGTNWRSDRSLVASVQALFGSVPDPFLNEQIPLPDVAAHFPDRLSGGPAFALTLVARPESEEQDKSLSSSPAFELVVRQLVADIEATLQSGQLIETASGTRRIEPSDIAVLCHAGRHLRHIQEQLAVRGLPSVLQTDQSVYTSPEAAAVGHIMRAVLNPGHPGRMASALATPVFGFDAERLDALMRDNTAELSQFVEWFREWDEIWHRDGFMVMWRRVLDTQATVPRLAAQITGLRQITNLLHLGEMLHQQAVTAHSGPDELLRWFEQTLRRDCSARDDDALLRLETDAAAIQLCTIHKSKGLEYPVVFCPTLWTTRKPSQPPYVLSRVGAGDQTLTIPELDVGSELLERRVERLHIDEAAEARRLLYVALTRPRHQCHVYWVAAAGAEQSALGQILFNSDETATPGRQSDAELFQSLDRWTQQLSVPRAVAKLVEPPHEDWGRSEFMAGTESDVLMTESDSLMTESAPFKAESDRVLACRPITRPVLPAVVQTSFTALAASGTTSHGAAALPAGNATRFDDLTDRDAPARFELDFERSAGNVAGSVTAGSVTAGSATTESVTAEASELIALAEMPGGRRVGTVVHDLLERLLSRNEIAGRSEDAVREIVRRRLEPELPRAQLESHWLDPLAKCLTRCLTGTLEVIDSSCSLSAIAPERMLCEMPFLVRLGSPESRFSIDALAAAFESSNRLMLRQYGSRVRRMNAHSLRGLLAGFIDLIFEWQGRWYIVDYKTNQLGPTRGDYSDDGLERAMIAHDYILQASLYAVAVEKFLQQRMAGFDFARDFGGVLYVFLRGLPESGSLDRGIYFDRPEPELIDALGTALSGRALTAAIDA